MPTPPPGRPDTTPTDDAAAARRKWAEFDRRLEERQARQAAALVRFNRWREYLSLAGAGYWNAAAERVTEALRDVRDYRDAHNQQPNMANEEACLMVRVIADTLANQIQAEAGSAQDDATVRWVVAGLRCPSSPFCTGCLACQTVLSPTRPCD